MLRITDFNRPFSLPRALRPSLIAACALWLSACSISTPLGPIFGSASEQTTTGSITLHDKRFSSDLTDEDWLQVTSALQSAFDPQAAGRAALWQNSASGRQGSVTAVSDAHAEAKGQCRAFVALVANAGDDRWYQGQACQDDKAPWAVTNSSPWSLPKAG